MAERNLGTVHECDRAGCRKRKGVAQVEAVITITRPGGEPEINRTNGELCPAHYGLAVRQAENWFANRKVYLAR